MKDDHAWLYPDNLDKAPLHILLISDNLKIFERLRLLLSPDSHHRLAGQTSSSKVATSLIETSPIDLILLDLDQPDVQISQLAEFREKRPQLKMIGLTGIDSNATRVYRFLKAGLDACLSIDSLQTDFRQSLIAIKEDRVFLSENCANLFVRILRKPLTQNPTQFGDAESYLRLLTVRERQLLSLMLHGLEYEEIAEICDIAVSTVKTHIGALLLKLNAKNRSQAILRAWQSDLILLLEESLNASQKERLGDYSFTR